MSGVVLATHRGEVVQGRACDDERDRFAISTDEVHVWRASLERPPAGVARLRRLLAPDERRRADRFRFERDRSRFIVGRGLLRELLGRYVGLEPEQVRFQYGAFDKPELVASEPEVAHAGPWFNVSHSGTVALYAVSGGGDLGVDVELDDADFAKERIAERFFSPAEVDALRSLPLALQPRGFLTCWTRKEAFIKARGDGLSLALDSFDVTLDPDAPAAVLRTAWSADEPREWRMSDLSDPDAGYIAAVAMRGSDSRVVLRGIFDTIESNEKEQEK